MPMDDAHHAVHHLCYPCNAPTAVFGDYAVFGDCAVLVASRATNHSPIYCAVLVASRATSHSPIAVVLLGAAKGPMVRIALSETARDGKHDQV